MSDGSPTGIDRRRFLVAFDVDEHLAPGATPPPGSALADSGEWEADQELQSLTRPVVPDVNGAPWLVP